MQEYHYLIPTQQQGLEKNIEHTFVCDDVEEAEDCFVDAKERLLDVNNWNKYSGIDGIGFKLTDSHGRAAARHARKGDHIEINMPGQVSDTTDWTAIEAIEYDDYPDIGMETFAIRLHPCMHPSSKKADDAAYAVADNATSTFVILRRGRKLIATYHGRNEPANTAVKGVDIAWLGLSDEECARLISSIAEPGMVKR